MAPLPPSPAQYTDFLAAHGAFEGFTTGEGRPSYVALWPIEDIPGNNADIQIENDAPGFVAFAGDGGGEVLAFDASGAVFFAAADWHGTAIRS